MAWIICNCYCGCRRSKFFGSSRSSATSHGLCDSCKSKGHLMMRRRLLGETLVSVALRKRLILGVARVVNK